MSNRYADDNQTEPQYQQPFTGPRSRSRYTNLNLRGLGGRIDASPPSRGTRRTDAGDDGSRKSPRCERLRIPAGRWRNSVCPGRSGSSSTIASGCGEASCPCRTRVRKSDARGSRHLRSSDVCAGSRASTASDSGGTACDRRRAGYCEHRQHGPSGGSGRFSEAGCGGQGEATIPIRPSSCLRARRLGWVK